MKKTAAIAIVGRPNVGKSTLFNRIIKDRLAIVEDSPGVTRDRIYAYSEWLTRQFLVIDTGGLTFKIPAPFSEEIKMQVSVAIEEADIILFVVSHQEKVTFEDELIVKMLYQTQKPVILVVNKYDKPDNNYGLYEYLTLGLGDPIVVSAVHGIGIGDLLDLIISKISSIPETNENSGTSFAIVGRPNVGKSSLTNAILGEQRVIVSDIPGTTTDSIDTSFVRNNKQYNVIDTAGIRRRGKIVDQVEKYSVLRATRAISRANLVLLILDGSVPISDQDTNIGGIAYEQNKPVILVINKWDLVAKDEKTMLTFEKKVRHYFKYLKYAKIIFLSAKENKRIHLLFNEIDNVSQAVTRRVQTSVLNEILVKAQLLNPPPDFNGSRLKIYYATQPEANIPTFILFCNSPKYVHFSYQRFLENQIRETFNFSGVPINLIFRERR